MATHIVFDLDDTLYPERDYAVGGFRAAAAWAERELGLAISADRMVALLDAGHLGRLFGQVLKEAKPDHTEAELGAFVKAYGQHQPNLTLFPDAADALAHFEARGPLGLITDGHAPTQHAKIRALALGPRFRRVIATGELGPGRAFHKPHPRAFELMTADFGAPGDRWIYVGDNIAKDFVAPNAMGWTSIMVDRPSHRAHRIHKTTDAPAGGAPHHVIEDLSRLATLVG